jgi:REP element-mobilizing transposase RayT
MPRIPRDDFPGSWHHVFNRAIARRTLFEHREDYRFFLSGLARAVRRGELELHAYCLLGTHYHLLVRSPVGNVAGAMQRVQLAYSRWFNRSRRRDGSLVRGRYRSKPVRSLRYRRTLVGYIDFNPCSAGVVDHPFRYAWGSAAHYSRPTGPAWLERSWVESEVVLASGAAHYRPERYERAFPTLHGDERHWFVQARLSHGGDEDLIDDVLGASDAPTRSWMLRKAMLADGTRPGLPLFPLARLDGILKAERATPWIVERGRQKRDGWAVAYAGIGRDLCGATLTSLATAQGNSLSQLRTLYTLHRAKLEDGVGDYCSRVIELARRGWDGWNQG